MEFDAVGAWLQLEAASHRCVARLFCRHRRSVAVDEGNTLLSHSLVWRQLRPSTTRCRTALCSFVSTVSQRAIIRTCWQTTAVQRAAYYTLYPAKSPLSFIYFQQLIEKSTDLNNFWYTKCWRNVTYKHVYAVKSMNNIPDFPSFLRNS